MIVAVIDIDAGDEIGQVISFHAGINSTWRVFQFHENFKIKL